MKVIANLIRWIMFLMSIVFGIAMMILQAIVDLLDDRGGN